LGVSQRATATNILAVSQAPNSSNNYIPGYTLALQTDNQGFQQQTLFKECICV
jgi:hypothetical protein